MLLNYLPASHVSWCVEQVRRGGNATIYANIHVGVGDREAAAPRARYDLFSYAVVDAYASSFTRAGYGDAIQAIQAAHRAGDRTGALAAVPDEMVDAIDVVGDEALVRETISAYRHAGVDVPVVFPLTWGAAGQDALESTLRAAITRLPLAVHGSELQPAKEAAQDAGEDVAVAVGRLGGCFSGLGSTCAGEAGASSSASWGSGQERGPGRRRCAAAGLSATGARLHEQRGWVKKHPRFH